MSQNRALRLLGVAKSSRHYRIKPRPRTSDPIAHKDRSHPARLSQVDYQRISDVLRASDVSIAETFYRHLDGPDPYLASQSTFHRVARREGLTMNRTGRRTRRVKGPVKDRGVPQLCATGPGQVVCWDITFLPGTYRGTRYALYMVIDLYSRKIVGWSVQLREDKYSACDLIGQIVNTHKDTLTTVHSDNGAAMTSNMMKTMLEDAGIGLSTIRPGVSNDNAHMESAFRTVKYGPSWPGTFDDLDHAHRWVGDYVHSYNHDHHHTSLAGYTPADVYDGTWQATAHRRQERLESAYLQHPERYRARPQVKIPPQQVTLNLVNNHEKTHYPSTLQELLAP